MKTDYIIVEYDEDQQRWRIGLDATPDREMARRVQSSYTRAGKTSYLFGIAR